MSMSLYLTVVLYLSRGELVLCSTKVDNKANMIGVVNVQFNRPLNVLVKYM